MEGQNILYGNIDDLRMIYGAVEEQNALRSQIESAQSKKNELTRDIDAEEKHLKEVIDSTIRKRRDDFTLNFDREMSKAQDRLKKKRSERNKAKTKGVEARIEAETNELIQSNKNLRNEIRTIFKQKGVWRFLDNKLIYILYYPKSVREKIAFIAIAILSLVMIPSVVVSMTDIFWLFDVLLYIFVLALFGGLYVLGHIKVKIKSKDAFEDTKIQRSSILKNEAKIRRIIKSIKKDKDEEQYELSQFDEDIAEIEKNINDIVIKKNEALADFEKTTKIDIEEEITKRDIHKIEILKKQLNELTIMLKELEDAQKNLTISVSTKYTAYIGEGNLTLETLEKMMQMMSEGRAETIGDAINILKTEQMK